MQPGLVIVVAIGSYLLGAISFARLITRLVAPEVDLDNVDLPVIGDEPVTHLKQVGATTAAVKLGKGWGCTIGLLDILKVTLVTLGTRVIFPEQPYFLIAAVMGMVGHNWPIYYRFKGGGGMSAMYGGFLAIDPLGALVSAFAGLFVGMVIVRDVLLGYVLGPWLMIAWIWLFTRDWAYVAYAATVNLLFLIALIPDIRDQIKAHREGYYDMDVAMQTFPMGQMMLKMMEKLKLRKS